MASNPKVAVRHFRFAIKHQILHDRFQANIEFVEINLKKNFTGFFKHAIKVANAFQIADSGIYTRNSPTDTEANTHNNNRRHRGANEGASNGGINGNGNGRGGGNPPTDKTKTDEKSPQLPLCLWPPHMEKGILHMPKDCKDCPQAEEQAPYDKRAEDGAKERAARNARKDPAAGTCSQTRPPPTPPAYKQEEKLKTFGQMKCPIDAFKSLSSPVTANDGPATHTGVGRFDDGSDKSIAAPSFAQHAVLQGIGRMSAINPVRIQVALKGKEEAATVTFHRT